MATATRMLFVCHSNVLASPIAAALMAFHARLNESEIEVASGGIEVGGRRFHRYVDTILDQRDMELKRMTSQRLSKELVAGADIILTMTASQANTVTADHPEQKAKVFLLDHFGQIVRPQLPDSDHATWLETLCRHPRDYTKNLTTWDIAAPAADTESDFRKLADRIDELTGWIATIISTARTETTAEPV